MKQQKARPLLPLLPTALPRVSNGCSIGPGAARRKGYIDVDYSRLRAMSKVSTHYMSHVSYLQTRSIGNTDKLIVENLQLSSSLHTYVMCDVPIYKFDISHSFYRESHRLQIAEARGSSILFKGKKLQALAQQKKDDAQMNKYRKEWISEHERLDKSALRAEEEMVMTMKHLAHHGTIGEDVQR